jgi:nucleotide-binding universal stress UspA family protein
MYEKIMVAIDGSKASEKALEHALEFASSWEADLSIVSVIPSVSPLRMLGRDYEEDVKQGMLKVLETAEVKINKDYPRLNFSTRLEDGRPEDVIVKVAEEMNADLIIIGSRGMGGITGRILGSTSRRVVDSCTKPILVIK